MQQFQQHVSACDWFHTTRSDLRGSGTDADVYVVVYGEKGDTGERVLDNSLQNNFERGKVRSEGLF